VVHYEVVERVGDSVDLLLRGRMVGETTARRLHEALADHYVDDGVRRIRVRLEALEFIDLEGVGALLDLWRSADGGGSS
jgi:anti-anti-sigma regulatory factor